MSIASQDHYQDFYDKKKTTAPERTPLRAKSACIKNRYKHILPVSSLVLLVVILTTCSHTKPFYHDAYGQPPEILLCQENIVQRLLLIGDAGEPEEQAPVLDKLSEWASRAPAKTTTVFLGDNIYPNGMPDKGAPNRKTVEIHLSSLVDTIAKSGSRGYFLAGNHDWYQGLEGLIRQEEYIEEKMGKKTVFLPMAGCPGPEKIDIANIRLIFLDSHLWLYPNIPPREQCPHRDIHSALETLKSYLRTAEGRHIVVLAHNPLDSHGIHGGFYDWRAHLFPLTFWKRWLWLPLPIIGSLIHPFLRWQVIKHPQELNSPEYKTMIAQFEEAFLANRPLISAGGHEHSLQVLCGGKAADYILVSGAGSASHINIVGDGANTLFAHAHTGFMAVDFMTDGSVWLYVVEPADPDVVFKIKLK